MTARVFTVVAFLLAGCARATLPYTPDPQPADARLSAAYQVIGDRLRVEIDTDRRPLEEASIIRSDGATVRAQSLEKAPPTPRSPTTVGVGIGGGTWGGHVGGGGDLSVGIPVGGGARAVDANTYAWFSLAEAGPAPWRLQLKVAGVPAVLILVGAAPSR